MQHKADEGLGLHSRGNLTSRSKHMERSRVQQLMVILLDRS